MIGQNGRVVETERFAWDDQDRLVASVDSTGFRRQVATYSYDALGRLISVVLLEVSGIDPRRWPLKEEPPTRSLKLDHR